MLTLTRCLALVFFIGFASTLCAAVSTSVEPPKIHVFSCQVFSGIEVPRSDDVGLAIRFRNDSGSALSAIVWRAKYGKDSVDFFDDGTFSPNLRIDNFVLAEQGSAYLNLFAALLDVAALGVRAVPPTTSVMKANMALPLYVSTAEPTNCSLIRATFADGQTWIDPAIEQQAKTLTQPSLQPTPRAVSAPDAVTDPIHVTHCIFEAGYQPQLQVTFQNTTALSADRIVLRGAYGQSGIDFPDQGTFAPGTLVKHVLKHPKLAELRAQSYYSLDDASNCTVVNVHFADGSSWQNPVVDAAPGPLPTTAPEALNAVLVKIRWSPRHGFPTPLPSTSPSATSQ